ncbi:MAG: hypothetical protein H0W76_13690 [Pyrinomonadaceae bacterium]|nr:hypothetical protein [Pyrinomonadaceae bacterium]
MSTEGLTSKEIIVVQGKPIEDVLRRAVHHALLTHKRAGNPIVIWKGGEVVIIPAEEIVVEDISHHSKPELQEHSR